ncbi:MAG: hypothetical protein ACHQTF_07105, partial [Gemmatimonadales bacterium]
MQQTNGHPLTIPSSIDDTGIRRSVLEDLALKTIFVEGEVSVRVLADRMGVGFAVAEDLFQRLRKRKLCDVSAMDGLVPRITPNGSGAARALELLAANQYVGPAPVSLADYVHRVREQSVGLVEVGAADVDRAFEKLVLGPDLRKQLGIAILAARSIVLYGPSGTGKTAIAELIPDVYLGGVWIPHAVEHDSQIITVYD